MSPFGLSEIRAAFRGLQRSPIIALSAVACIALGLGSTATISSAVDRALVQRLPFRAPERIVTVYRTTPHFDTGTTADILRLVTRQAMRLLAIGIGIGLAASLAATKLLVSLLYGVSPLDASAWLAATVTLGLAGFVAALLPAWRATRADPVVALRAE